MNGVALGWVHGGTVHEKFMESVVSSLLCAPRLIKTCIAGSGTCIAANRNYVCREFLKLNEEWLWFVDTDIVFSRSDLPKLLEIAVRKDLKILSGLYFGKLKYESDALSPIWFLNHRPASRIEGLVKLDAVGMGCCLIHRTVLEKMAKTYTEDEWTWFGHDLVNGKRLSEDMTFCHRAKACGFEVYGTSEVSVSHIKPKLEGLETFVQSTLMAPAA